MGQVGREVRASLPNAVRVPAILILFEDENGGWRSSLRWAPGEGLGMPDCLDLLTEALIAAVRKHTHERVMQGMASLSAMLGRGEGEA